MSKRNASPGGPRPPSPGSGAGARARGVRHRRRDDRCAPCGMGGEDATVGPQGPARRRHEGGGALEPRQRPSGAVRYSRVRRLGLRRPGARHARPSPVWRRPKGAGEVAAPEGHRDVALRRTTDEGGGRAHGRGCGGWRLGEPGVTHGDDVQRDPSVSVTPDLGIPRGPARRGRERTPLLPGRPLPEAGAGAPAEQAAQAGPDGAPLQPGVVQERPAPRGHCGGVPRRMRPLATARSGSRPARSAQSAPGGGPPTSVREVARVVLAAGARGAPQRGSRGSSAGSGSPAPPARAPGKESAGH